MICAKATTHLGSFGYRGDVWVEVRGLWVTLHQEHTDVVEQGLAGVCIPHLGQLLQVAQLKTPGLEAHEASLTLDNMTFKVDASWGMLTLHPLRKFPMANTVARMYRKVWLAESCSMANLRWKRGSAISWKGGGYRSRADGCYTWGTKSIHLCKSGMLLLSLCSCIPVPRSRSREQRPTAEAWSSGRRSARESAGRARLEPEGSGGSGSEQPWSDPALPLLALSPVVAVFERERDGVSRTISDETRLKPFWFPYLEILPVQHRGVHAVDGGWEEVGRRQAAQGDGDDVASLHPQHGHWWWFLGWNKKNHFLLAHF